MSTESWGARLTQTEDAVSLPPQDLDAERALLGAMVINTSAIAVAMDRVTSGEFYRPSHAIVFTAIVAMDDRGEAVDAITLAADLRRQGLLDKAGGHDFIYALPDLCPVAASVAEYALIVREQAHRRAGIVLAQRLEQAFTDGALMDQEAAAQALLRLLGTSPGDCSCHGAAAKAGPG